MKSLNPYLIIDLYVDEPACLGVPPFMATYPRYIAGALRAAGIGQSDILYLTIDDLRRTEYRLEHEATTIFLVGGYTVPGKYLTTKIGTAAELEKILKQLRFDKTPVFIGGPMARLDQHSRRRLSQVSGAHFVTGDIEKIAHLMATQGSIAEGELMYKRSVAEIDEWAPLGAFIARQSPFAPYLIHELESYRGCTRNRFCSFCTEPLYGRPTFRGPEAIAQEVAALLDQGQERFRLGRQADLLTYGTDFSEYRASFPRPKPESLQRLYRALAALPRPKLWHMDNLNPGTMVHFPHESQEILHLIVAHHTPGDTAPLGLESLDPRVMDQNQLKVSPEQAMQAIATLNHIGGQAQEGLIPPLLPGINLIHGLVGEGPETFRINYEFLARVRDRGLLLRRINLRQVKIYERTPIAKAKLKQKRNLYHRFQYYKEKIRDDIDRPMLEQIFPIGMKLDEVLVEQTEAMQNEYSLGRPLWSYPITCKIPLALPARTMVDVVVIGHDRRSLIALPRPLRINNWPEKALRRLPGLGRQGAKRVLWHRPFADAAAFWRIVQPAEPFRALTSELDFGTP